MSVDFVDQRMPFTLSLWLTSGSGRLGTCRRAVILGFLRLVFRFPERERQLAYSDLSRPLAPWHTSCPSWLRPLHCSRLSPGVAATMSRSDSSNTPGKPSSDRVVGPIGVIEVSLGHAHIHSHRPSAKHAAGSYAGLRHESGSSPTCHAARVHCPSRPVFGSGPSPPPSRGVGCLCLRRLSCIGLSCGI